ncbi:MULTISPECIES: Fe-S cluster assembly scaffold protein NifU [unclassified Fusibacter]|uniref:Fe-S cluster assembly scaffold protein NifU n=1 Tax=unclassified Fusibacter TaxID=2624464 RepID=UPI0010137C85|nr:MULTISPECIES: Fe-S cluster assembly scaffold protein NifU [unclassified Fusibacter]MCK8058921.1 Fe-S cluster assembly scaffold protein NifU [Fusibacter sp. A2]NPE21996.1 Fe-S cluster assembly scaffold protein NifU [Fusibacter sp. A1]RXV61561.1 Fe-S cluster assembly scaffold protein NifU [Fusibacter sp. A1]
MYNDIVMEHFMNPQNVGVIEDADGVGQVGNVKCGDIMKIYLKISADEVIEDIKFKTFGCGSAVASSSMATVIIKGKTVEEALQITNKDVLEALGGLPAVKVHCSVLAEQALKSAVYDYAQKNGKHYDALEGFDPNADDDHHDHGDEDGHDH